MWSARGAWRGAGREARSGRAVGQLGLFCVLEGHELGDRGPENVEVEHPHAWSLPGCMLGVERERECEVHCGLSMSVRVPHITLGSDSQVPALSE